MTYLVACLVAGLTVGFVWRALGIVLRLTG